MKFEMAITEMVKEKTSELFSEIKMVCTAQKINVGSDETNCTITNDLVSLTVETNAFNGELSVSEWDYRVHIPGESISGFHFSRKALSKTCFVPDWPTGCALGWRENRRATQPFLSVAELAEKCVNQFIALEQRKENGQIKPQWEGNARPSRP